MVISPTVDRNFISLVADIMAMYNELGVYCRSLSMAWPPLGAMSPPRPAVLRLGSRGSCHSAINDVSSLELYSIYSVNMDPVTTINNFKQKLMI